MLGKQEYELWTRWTFYLNDFDALVKWDMLFDASNYYYHLLIP